MGGSGILSGWFAVKKFGGSGILSGWFAVKKLGGSGNTGWESGKPGSGTESSPGITLMPENWRMSHWLI